MISKPCSASLSRCRCLAIAATLILILWPWTGARAGEAVVPDLYLRPVPNQDLSGPYGAAVDPSGNIYVADTFNHRIVKYDSFGRPKLTWGTFGSDPGQLYYPLGIAIGADPVNGSTRIFVVDSANNRISVFSDRGNFLFTFGTWGSGDGELDRPEGIAALPPNSSIVPHVCVADTRNSRISCFDMEGNWLRSFYCSTCPDQRFFKPVGIAFRVLQSGQVMYVVDNYPGRVHILNRNGTWIRSFGGPGTSGELSFPDDIAVDPDTGAAFVVDSGIGIERAIKFNPDGTPDYSFNSDGLDSFLQPHGIAMDGQGRVYVVSTGTGTVTAFRIAAPELRAAGLPSATRKYWTETLGAWFELAYNGVEQSCSAGGKAVITATGQGWTIRAAASGIPVAFGFNSVKMDLTASQMSQIRKVWTAGGTVNVSATFKAICDDGTRLSKTVTFAK